MKSPVSRRQTLAAIASTITLPAWPSHAGSTNQAGAAPTAVPDMSLAAAPIGSPGLSLDMFGPCGKGDGLADDKAFRLAFEFLKSSRRATSISGNGGLLYPANALFVPPGDYEVRGGFGHGLTRIGIWGVPGTVTIRNTDPTTYFLEIAGRIDALYVNGIHFIGGRGTIRHSFTGNNVAEKHIVEKCVFMDYLECAIVSNAEDMPYWIIRDNQFYCDQTEQGFTRGVVLGGLMDNALIQNNSFLRNNVHLQLGPFRSGNVRIENNDFLSFQKDRTDADVWLIPNDELGGFGTNAGQGSSFVGNKFGNENITTLAKKAPRILVSAAQGGSREAYRPDAGWKQGDDGRHWLQGIAFHGNRFSSANIGGTGGTGGSLMQISVENVGRVHWAADNFVDSGQYQYLFHHIDGGRRRSDRTNTNWEVRIGSGMRGDAGSALVHGVSNRPVGPIDDPFGIVPGPTTTLPQPDPHAKLVVDTKSGAQWLLEDGVKAGKTVAKASEDAAETFLWQRAAAIGLALPDMVAFADRLAWIVAVIKGDATGSPAMSVRFAIANVQDWTMAHRMIIPVGKEWLTVTTPFIVPKHAVPASFQFRLEVDERQTFNRTLTVARAQVIVGRSPDWRPDPLRKPDSGSR